MLAFVSGSARKGWGGLVWMSVLGFAGIAPLAAQERSLDLGRIQYEADRSVIPVYISADSLPAEAVLRNAFGLHGTYRVQTEDKATFTFRFIGTGSDRVTLAISSGRPRKEQLREVFSGTDSNDALLRAADRAVEKTSGLRGIFRGQVAFISDRTGNPEVYVGDLLFAAVRRITNDREQAIGPKFGPGGDRLVYTGYYRNGFPDLYRIHLPTGRRDVLVSFRGTNTGGTFSPDGQDIAVSMSGVGNAEIYLVDTEGKNVRRLTRSPALETDPAWSPDGRELIFTSDRLGQPQLYTVSKNGGEMQRVPTNISRYCAEPAWNPVRPNLILFTAAQGPSFSLALFDRSTGESRFLTPSGFDAVEGCWLDDGRHVLFTERTAERRRLMLLDTETGERSAIHSADFGNSWQADFMVRR